MTDNWVTVTSASDVTAEILDVAESIADGWYEEGPIDWEDLLERLEGMSLGDDDNRLDLGTDMDSPAIRLIKNHITSYRRMG